MNKGLYWRGTEAADAERLRSAEIVDVVIIVGALYLIKGFNVKVFEYWRVLYNGIRHSIASGAELRGTARN